MLSLLLLLTIIKCSYRLCFVPLQFLADGDRAQGHDGARGVDHPTSKEQTSHPQTPLLPVHKQHAVDTLYSHRYRHPTHRRLCCLYTSNMQSIRYTHTGTDIPPTDASVVCTQATCSRYVILTQEQTSHPQTPLLPAHKQHAVVTLYSHRNRHPTHRRLCCLYTSNMQSLRYTHTGTDIPPTDASVVCTQATCNRYVILTQEQTSHPQTPLLSAHKQLLRYTHTGTDIPPTDASVVCTQATCSRYVILTQEQTSHPQTPLLSAHKQLLRYTHTGTDIPPTDASVVCTQAVVTLYSHRNRHPTHRRLCCLHTSSCYVILTQEQTSHPQTPLLSAHKQHAVVTLYSHRNRHPTHRRLCCLHTSNMQLLRYTHTGTDIPPTDASVVCTQATCIRNVILTQEQTSHPQTPLLSAHKQHAVVTLYSPHLAQVVECPFFTKLSTLYLYFTQSREHMYIRVVFRAPLKCYIQ